MAVTHPEWIDLVDPDEEELRKHLPENLHESALRTLLARHDDANEPRPRIVSYGDYVFGIFLVPVAVPDEDRVYYQEVDFVATPEQLVSVSKTSPGEEAFDPKPAKEACQPDDKVGMFIAHLIESIAERYLDLIDDLDGEIDELEDTVGSQPPKVAGKRLRELRQDLREIRRTLTPTRDAVHKILDDRVELDGASGEDGKAFPREVKIAFGDAYDKLLRATEGLDSSRDALAGVRDYLQGTIANEQNEVVKRLAVVASLLLVPTLIVGVYGQNFDNIPELHWGWGYWWSWGWIIATTIAQLVFFRWKRWI